MTEIIISILVILKIAVLGLIWTVKNLTKQISKNKGHCCQKDLICVKNFEKIFNKVNNGKNCNI